MKRFFSYLSICVTTIAIVLTLLGCRHTSWHTPELSQRVSHLGAPDSRWVFVRLPDNVPRVKDTAVKLYLIYRHPWGEQRAFDDPLVGMSIETPAKDSSRKHPRYDSRLHPRAVIPPYITLTNYPALRSTYEGKPIQYLNADRLSETLKISAVIFDDGREGQFHPCPIDISREEITAIHWGLGSVVAEGRTFEELQGKLKDVDLNQLRQPRR